MKRLLGFLLTAMVCVCLCGCGSSKTEDDPNALTDAEWGQVQQIFAEYVGKDIEYRPVYCGEWREGKQYKTENYAYGQYLINMDTDGYVHLVVWVQDKKGEEGREVVYNRLEDENAPAFAVPDDGSIHLIDGELGEYGKEVTIPGQTYGEYTHIWYTIPAANYRLVNEASRGTVFVVADADSSDVRTTLRLSERGETAELVVEDGTHIETSAGTRVSLMPIN